LFCIENHVELLDLPDEMILAIMNKIKQRPILLYSMIGIKNIRLEQLALGQSHSIDLTSDYFDTSYKYEKFIRKFISFTLPSMFNHIKSLTIDIIHIRHLDYMTEEMKNKNCLKNLKHLKIMAGRLNCYAGISFRTGNLYLIVLFLFEYLHLIRQKLTRFMI
jgi:hypothetical protein